MEGDRTMSFKLFNFRNFILVRGMKVILLFSFVFALSREVVSLPNDGIAKRDVVAFEFLTYRSSRPDKTFLEAFCQIPTNSLQFVKFEDGFFGSYRLSIALHDQSGRQVVEQSYLDSIKVQAFREIDLPRPSKIIRFTFLVEPGEYEARIELSDVETLRGVNVKKVIQVPDYSENILSLSDLQIATSIWRSNENHQLVKNGRWIVPNVPHLVTPNSNVIYVYSEIYNFQFSSERPNQESIATYIIENEKGEEIKSIQLSIKKPGTTGALSVKLPVAELETGQYQLTLKVADLDSERTVKKSTNFLVLKPGLDHTHYLALLAEAYGKNTSF